MPHYPPPRKIVIPHAPAPRNYTPPVVPNSHPIVQRFEIKKILQNVEFQNTLPENLKERVKSIFAGCGCNSSGKIDAILPELREYINAFAKKNYT